MVQTEDVPHKPAKRPRPSMAPRLLAGGDALRKATPGTAASSHDAPALPTAGRDQRGWAAPPQATWGSAYYEEVSMTAESPDISGDDSISEHSVEDHCIYMESDRPAGVSPLWPEGQTRESVSPRQDPVSEGPGRQLNGMASRTMRICTSTTECKLVTLGQRLGSLWM